MAQFDTWESYLYPPPHDRTLRNREGIVNRLEALDFERTQSLQRHASLMENPALVDHTFDAAHVRAIHRHLFQDVYDWAGEYRTQNMQRAGDFVGFATAENGGIEEMLDIVSETVRRPDWPTLRAPEFVDEAATVFTALNQAHPFREGNGRTAKVFMEHVAMQSRFTLDFSTVDPELWNHLSAMSRPQPERPTLSPEAIAPAFAMATVERTGTPSPQTSQMSRLRSASYPQSPRSALGERPTPGSASRRPRGPAQPERGVGAVER